MTKKQKTDLFRFVTLRSPQILTQEKEDLGFVKPSSAVSTGSYFIDPTDLNGLSLADIKTHFTTEAGTFPTPKSLTEIKAIDSDMWLFSQRLMEIRNSIKRTDFDNSTASPAITPPTALTEGEKREIWDQLYYYIVTKGNANIREACLQLIVAYNFIDKYEDYSDDGITDEAVLEQEHKDLKRLANAKVVLHQALSAEKTTNAASTQSNYKFNKVLSERHKAQVASLEVERLKVIRKELEDLDKQYATDYSAAKATAIATNISTNSEAIGNYKTANPSLFNATEELQSRSVFLKATQTDEETQEYSKYKPVEEDIVPDDELTPLSFSYDNPLSETYMTGKTTKGTRQFIEDEKLEELSVKEALDTVETCLDKAKKAARVSFKNRVKEFVVNGIKTFVPQSTDNDCIVSVNPILQDDDSIKYSLLLTIDTAYDSALLNSINMTFNISGTDYTANSAKIISNEADILVVELFADALLTTVPDSTVFTLTGIFSLNNGDDFTLSLTGNTSSETNYARAAKHISQNNDCSLRINSFDGDPSTEYTLYLTIDTAYDNALINLINMTFTMSGTDYVATSAKLISNYKDKLVVELFTDNTFSSMPANTDYTFSGTFSLNNGADFTLNMTGNTDNVSEYGRAISSVPVNDPTDLSYGINTIGIADFRRVEQELCCYIPGEVSHIENVMAKEYKEHSTRNLLKSETSTSTETESEIESENETTSAERFEMSSEMSKALEETRDRSFGFDASTSIEKAKTFTFNGGVSGEISFGESKSKSDTQARSFAEDVTKRALERVQQKVSSKRKSKMIQEFEEKNNHGFDNRTGEAHVTGVYRWIDKVYNNRIVNYGKRLIYEFMIPEPAKFYKEAIIIKAEETDNSVMHVNQLDMLDLVMKPEQPPKSAAEIGRDNYHTLAAKFGVKVPAPKDKWTKVSGIYSEAFGEADKFNAFSYQDLFVPQDYKATKIEGKVNCSFKSTTGKSHIAVNIAGKSGTEDYNGNSNDSFELTAYPQNLEGAIPVSVMGRKITNVSVSVKAHCKLKDDIYKAWKQEVYEIIMDAYNAQMDAYIKAENAERQTTNEAELEDAQRTALANANKPKDEVLKSHSKFNAEIVNTELKRLCIEMMLAPFELGQGAGFYNNGDHDIPQLQLSDDLDIYAARVKFFEQAFDWDIMAQKFYPYYWAKKEDWKTLFQTRDGKDRIFQAFLQSGMGRVMVPVRPGFEDAVVYFMETGEVWNGTGVVLETEDKLYLSLVDEAIESEGVVEGAEWETIVPSSLTLLQNKSVILDETGLPCCDGELTTNLIESTTILNQEPSA